MSETDTRRGEDSGPAVTEDITALSGKEKPKTSSESWFDEGRAIVTILRSQDRLDFRIGLAATPVTSAAPRQFQAPMTDNRQLAGIYELTWDQQAQLSTGWQYEVGTKPLNHAAINRLIQERM